jgi:DNA-binding response OmpR family regulator
MAKILVVDDEKKIRDVIKEYALFNNYEVNEAEDGMIAVSMVEKADYDLIVMDVMMPKLDGFSATKKIKKLKNIPIIMLTARGEEYDKLFGFEVGIDDYMIKPFSPKELMARIGVILARTIGVDTTEKEDETKMVFGGLEIDTLAHDVVVDGKSVNLTPKEYDLLLYLVRNKNIVFSRKKLLTDIWEGVFTDDDASTERTVDTHIKNIRNALGDNYKDMVSTIRGVGYKFEAKL